MRGLFLILSLFIFNACGVETNTPVEVDTENNCEYNQDGICIIDNDGTVIINSEEDIDDSVQQEDNIVQQRCDENEVNWFNHRISGYIFIDKDAFYGETLILSLQLDNSEKLLAVDFYCSEYTNNCHSYFQFYIQNCQNYNLSIIRKPTDLICSITNGSGYSGVYDIENLMIECR